MYKNWEHIYYSLTPVMKESLFRVALFAIEQLLLIAPELFIKLKTLFDKPNVTVEDISNLRAEIVDTSYKDIVKNTRIPLDQQT